MNILKILSEEKQSLLNTRTLLMSILRKMPEGSIKYIKNEKYTRWVKTGDGKDTPIRKSEVFVAQELALKRHLTDSLEAAEKQMQLIDMMLDAYPKIPVYPDFLSVKCEDHKNLLRPYFEGMRAEKEAWTAGSYPKSSNFPEKLIVPTKASIFVRSKSEAIIANELYDNHIPFHYEQELKLNGAVFNPDFIIPVFDNHWNAVMESQNELRGSESRGRKLIIWEHFGMMDDKRYLTNAVYKLSNYLDAGFVPGRDLLFTFESKNAPLDSRLVSLMVAYYLQ